MRLSYSVDRFCLIKARQAVMNIRSITDRKNAARIGHRIEVVWCGLSQVDYVQNLTMLAVVGECGFDKVVGIGEYLLAPSCNLAEVACSVSSDWQAKGLGRRLINNLFEGTRINGIAGFIALINRSQS